MNRIVKEHYPVEKLPEDLRNELFPSKTVRLVIEGEEALPPGEAHFKRFGGLFKDRGVSSQESVRRIRELRDEWDE